MTFYGIRVSYIQGDTMFLRKLFARFPTRLPQGLQEFHLWATDIIKMTGLPDNDSMRWALGVSIYHLKETSSHVPKMYFVRMLMKGAASQVAAQVIQDLKNKQEAEAKKKAEETAESKDEVSTQAQDTQPA